MRQNFAPLCTACHAEKTANAPRTLALDFLASHFEKNVYDSYVKSERPPPLVYQLKEVADLQHCEIADVIRCRKRALEYNMHDIPIYFHLTQLKKCMILNLVILTMFPNHSALTATPWSWAIQVQDFSTAS